MLGHIFVVALLAAVVGAIFYKPAKTNGMYLQELIDTGTVKKLSERLVAQLRASPDTKDFKESDWKRIEEGLSECMAKEAATYEASGDPYLQVRANMETPTILANRFLKACGGID
jgi:coproporphyrinogen III oxidase